ncbi:MAG: enolase C-terminal domain-like protein [Planctomycetota bacterium]|nr:enolase C-terminal domain-like protein [Planctomycetota bacterium]
MTTITGLTVRDIRIPTSDSLTGSDAMNPDPDYSAAYVELLTDHPAGLKGHGLAFTIGRGNELCAAAIEAWKPFVVGQSLEEIRGDMRSFWRRMTRDSQLRWVGPEKGTVHLASAAIINAAWDLVAKLEEKPLWKLLADMSAEELVACIDFTYISDMITPEEAVELLSEKEPGKEAREKEMQEQGFPAYTTSTGWLGYEDEKIRDLCSQAIDQGWSHIKIKVGADLEDDIRRASIIREMIGSERQLMLDANQVWDVGEAIENMKHLAEFSPLWIEEPTSPDDVLGHAAIARAVAPIGVATGECCQNRVLFKQFLQAEAIQFVQIDSCRLGGVNEVLAVLLMAAKCGVPVCPHDGWIVLCEHLQHLAIFDYIRVGCSLENRVIEYVDNLHEHFENPVKMNGCRYLAPEAPGYSTTMHSDSLDHYDFPGGKAWSSR